MDLALGDTVLFLVNPKARQRPARIVKKWSSDLVNLVVDLDGTNDSDDFSSREITTCTAWRTSVRVFLDGKIPDGWTEPCALPRSKTATPA